MSVSRAINFTQYLRVLLMTLVVFGCGSVVFIFFQQLVDALVLLCITLLIVINGCKINGKLLISCFVFTIICIVHSLLVQLSIVAYFPLIYRFIVAVLIISVFNNDYGCLKSNLIKVLKFFCALSIINLVLIYILPSSFFVPTSADAGYFVRTLFYVFNYSAIIIESPVMVMRNAGPFWEPGVLQILMNILIYLILYERKENISKAILPIFVVISTFSTAGYAILGILLIIKYYKIIAFNLRGIIIIFSFLLIFVVVGYSLKDKFNNEGKEVGNSSSLLRIYDLMMATEIALDHWSLGIGYSPERVSELQNSRSIVLNDEEVSVERGVTNSVLQMFVYGGVFLATLYFWIVWRQNLFDAKKVFFIIWILILSSEPIIFTSLSWIIFVSGISKMKYKDENVHGIKIYM